MFMSILRGISFAAAFMLIANSARAEGVPADCSQLIVAIAPDWNSMRGQMQLFERSNGGKWTAAKPPVPGVFCKNGLAWGRGLAGEGGPGIAQIKLDGGSAPG